MPLSCLAFHSYRIFTASQSVCETSQKHLSCLCGVSQMHWGILLWIVRLLTNNNWWLRSKWLYKGWAIYCPHVCLEAFLKCLQKLDLFTWSFFSTNRSNTRYTVFVWGRIVQRDCLSREVDSKLWITRTYYPFSFFLEIQAGNDTKACNSV